MVTAVERLGRHRDHQGNHLQWWEELTLCALNIASLLLWRPGLSLLKETSHLIFSLIIKNTRDGKGE